MSILQADLESVQTSAPDDEYCLGCGYWVGYCDGGCPEYAAYVAAVRPAEVSSEPWSDADVYDWLDAAARDAERESGGGW